MIASYMELENEAREAQVVENTTLVSERRAAVAMCEKEKAERKQAEQARDAAIKDKEHAETLLAHLMERMAAIEKRFGQTDL
jgi:hypothetical protein